MFFVGRLLTEHGRTAPLVSLQPLTVNWVQDTSGRSSFEIIRVPDFPFSKNFQSSIPHSLVSWEDLIKLEFIAQILIVIVFKNKTGTMPSDHTCELIPKYE